MNRFFLYILLTCVAFNCISVQIFGKAGMPDLHERIYVQTDKQIYLAGEPVLMKFSTTDEKNIPLVFSKIGYAELVRDSIALTQIKVELINGTGSGQMVLPVDLPTGYYRLIAYTRFMRNEGAEVFFEKNIAVINTFQSGYQFSEVEPGSEHPVSTVKKSDSGTISLKPDKASYTTREHGELIITGLPGNIHTLSVSITGKEMMPVDGLMPVAESEESDTAINELYREYLANMNKANETDSAFVENGVVFYPGMKDKSHPIRSEDQITNNDRQQTKQNDKFLPEYEGHIITGKIVNNATGNPLPTNIEIGKINLYPVVAFPGESIWFFSGKIDETDRSVLFFTSGNPGTKEIAAVLYNAGEKYRIDIQSPFVNRFEPKQMPVLRIDSSRYDQLLSRSVALQVFRYFSKDPSESRNVSQSYLKAKPSSIYRLDDYTRFPTMAEVFTEIITNARFRRNSGNRELSVLIKRGSNYSYGYPLVLLDGVPVSDHELIYNYDPFLVESIRIYTDSYVLGTFLCDGIIEFKTYREPHRNLNKSSQIIKYETPQAPCRFETPDYSKEENRQSLMPDSRHTLLWDPGVRYDGETLIRVPFDTSDLTGEFQATVEGITKDGRIIFATSIFKVVL